MPGPAAGSKPHRQTGISSAVLVHGGRYRFQSPLPSVAASQERRQAVAVALPMPAVRRIAVQLAACGRRGTRGGPTAFRRHESFSCIRRRQGEATGPACRCARSPRRDRRVRAREGAGERPQPEKPRRDGSGRLRADESSNGRLGGRIVASIHGPETHRGKGGPGR
jgi:hypothetical protein